MVALTNVSPRPVGSTIAENWREPSFPLQSGIVIIRLSESFGAATHALKLRAVAIKVPSARAVITFEESIREAISTWSPQGADGEGLLTSFLAGVP
jgi:hypothetical protein